LEADEDNSGLLDIIEIKECILDASQKGKLPKFFGEREGRLSYSIENIFI